MFCKLFCWVTCEDLKKDEVKSAVKAVARHMVFRMRKALTTSCLAVIKRK